MAPKPRRQPSPTRPGIGPHVVAFLGLAAVLLTPSAQACELLNCHSHVTKHVPGFSHTLESPLVQGGVRVYVGEAGPCLFVYQGDRDTQLYTGGGNLILVFDKRQGDEEHEEYGWGSCGAEHA